MATYLNLLEVGIIGKTFVLREVVEFRYGLLLGLIELVIEFTCI